MKFLGTALAVLLAVSTARAECLSVEVLSPQKSSPDVHITVLRDGKPVSGAQVVLALNGMHLSLATNERGSVALPKLSPGRYQVSASDDRGLGAELVLDVSECQGQKPSSFEMALGYKAPPPPTEEQLIASAERMEVRDRVPTFEGVVEDPSGAPVYNTIIRLFPKGFRDKAHAMEIATDSEGRFSAPLTNGLYIAFFQSPGFKTFVSVVEVTQGGKAKGIRIILQIGMCT